MTAAGRRRPVSALISASDLGAKRPGVAASRRRLNDDTRVGVYGRRTSRRASCRDLGFSMVRSPGKAKPGSDLVPRIAGSHPDGWRVSPRAGSRYSARCRAPRWTGWRRRAGGSASPGSGSGAGGAGRQRSTTVDEPGRLDLKFGYGLPAFGRPFQPRLTPRRWAPACRTPGGITVLGWRLVRGGSGEGGGSIEISFDARRSESVNDDTQPVDEVGLRFTARF